MAGRGLYHLMRGAAVASEAIDGAHKGATWSRPRLLVRGEGLQIDGLVASFAWAGLAGLAGAKVPEDWYEVASVYMNSSWTMDDPQLDGEPRTDPREPLNLRQPRPRG